MIQTGSPAVTDNPKKKLTFKQKFVKFLFKKVPKRFKRIVFISSIMGMIEQSRDANMELVNKVNEIFQLAKDPKTFLLPVHFNSVIWTDITADSPLGGDPEANEVCRICLRDINDRILSHDECEAIGRHFAKNVPDWLKYGSFELMVSDVIRLVREIASFKVQNKDTDKLH